MRAVVACVLLSGLAFSAGCCCPGVCKPYFGGWYDSPCGPDGHCCGYGGCFGCGDLYAGDGHCLYEDPCDYCGNYVGYDCPPVLNECGHGGGCHHCGGPAGHAGNVYEVAGGPVRPSAGSYVQRSQPARHAPQTTVYGPYDRHAARSPQPSFSLSQLFSPGSFGPGSPYADRRAAAQRGGGQPGYSAAQAYTYRGAPANAHRTSPARPAQGYPRSSQYARGPQGPHFEPWQPGKQRYGVMPNPKPAAPVDPQLEAYSYVDEADRPFLAGPPVVREAGPVENVAQSPQSSGPVYTANQAYGPPQQWAPRR